MSAAVPPYPPQPHSPQQMQPHAKNGFGIASLVLGIVGIVTGFIPFVGIATALLLGLIGLVLGVLGFLRARKGIATNGTMSIIGSILSALAILVGLGSLILGVLFVGSVNEAAKKAANEPVSSGASSQPGDSQAAGPATGPTAFPGQMSKDVVGNAGDELTVAGVAVTAGPLQQTNSSFDTPVQCTDVSVKNTGTSTLSSFGTFAFKVQNPSGAATDATLSGLDGELPTADLAPGATAQGKVCFNADQVAPGQNVVLYSEPLSTAEERGAWINQL